MADDKKTKTPREEMRARGEEWVEHLNDRGDVVSYESFCERAGLTPEESEKLGSWLGPDEKRRLVRGGAQWTISFTDGANLLQWVYQMLLYWDERHDQGPSPQAFARALLGSHFAVQSVNSATGFSLRLRSHEVYNKIFELEVLCFFLANRFTVEVKDKDGPEFIAARDGITIAVEAKKLDIDSVLDTVFGSDLREGIRRAEQGLGPRPMEEKHERRLLDQFERNYDKALRQCQKVDADAATIFVQTSWPVSLMGSALQAWLTELPNDWLAQNEQYLARLLIVESGDVVSLPNPLCSGSASALLSTLDFSRVRRGVSDD